jgi:hypothetical protein
MPLRCIATSGLTLRLPASFAWTKTTSAPITNRGNLQLNLPNTNDNCFYRLQYP